MLDRLFGPLYIPILQWLDLGSGPTLHYPDEFRDALKARRRAAKDIAKVVRSMPRRTWGGNVIIQRDGIRQIDGVSRWYDPLLKGWVGGRIEETGREECLITLAYPFYWPVVVHEFVHYWLWHRGLMQHHKHPYLDENVYGWVRSREVTGASLTEKLPRDEMGMTIEREGDDGGIQTLHYDFIYWDKVA